MPRRHRITSATNRERIIEAYPSMTLIEIQEEVMEIFPLKSHFGLVMLSRYLEGELTSLMSCDTPAEGNSSSKGGAARVCYVDAGNGSTTTTDMYTPMKQEFTFATISLIVYC